MQILRFFRPELALSSGNICDSGAKKAPMPVRDYGVQIDGFYIGIVIQIDGFYLGIVTQIDGF